MTTLQQIDDFANFARQLAEAEGEHVPMDDLYDRWREQAYRDEDRAAVLASIRDFENGDRGRPVQEFLADLDGEAVIDEGT